MHSRTRIVILGGGFAGAYCAQSLEKHVRGADAEVSLINESNYFIFSPLLIEAGTGSLEPRHAVVPLRAFLTSTRFIMATVRGVDLDSQRVGYRLWGSDHDDEIPYDHLVVAPGSITRIPDVPGLKRFGFQIKGLSDAVALRDRAVQLLESADATADPHEKRALLNFVVVGGSYTGVEVAGEFEYFLRKACRVYPNVDQADYSVTLIEISDRILPALDRELADYARSHLEGRGIQVLLNSSVDELREDSVVLAGGESLPSRTLIWCAGIAANPLVAGLGLPLDELGFIRCRPDLRVEDFNNIWAIGDCASNPDEEGKPYPATAQHAVQLGSCLGENLGRVIHGESPRPCRISNKGSLAALGCRTGVAQLFGIKLAGFPAWFLWRSFYLARMPTLSRRIRVALDWTLDFFFSREFVQTGIHRPGDR